MINQSNTIGPPPVAPVQDRAPQPPPPGIMSCQHKGTSFFTIFFKVSAILFYLLGTLLFDSFVLTFILVVLLSSMDFWTVKNVSGRLLVGLRWWNDVDDAGKTKWYFESSSDRTKFDAGDSRLFWTALYVTPVVWLLLSIVSILKLNFGWLLIDLVALSLAGSNTYGFLQCDKDARTKMERMAKVGSLLI